MEAANDRQRIERVVDALETGVGSTVDRETLSMVVEADFDRYATTARITDFVPILVERDVRARLLKHRHRPGNRSTRRSTPNVSEPRG